MSRGQRNSRVQAIYRQAMSQGAAQGQAERKDWLTGPTHRRRHTVATQHPTPRQLQVD